ncbi:hypothetical protein [Rhodococcus sp. H29-C3]|uniref:hypothetical protein n=1 Tax=Rhodococcus sp. H29-C3 TaxID=3046307 RepID=UPI0024BAB982|nr:hypothetical protein [Rhodococcus sp. H29-C3]MDJ0362444.1 hypothetical protein [Rhodococcus sp. H29-C3]
MKEKDAVEWMASLGRIVLEGEQIRAFARVSSLRPLADGMAVTNRRLLLFSSSSLDSKGPLVEISALEIGGCEIKMRAAGRTLVVYADGREPRTVATVKASDADFVVARVNSIADARTIERPTVDVYDPFTTPWVEPTAAQGFGPPGPTSQPPLTSELSENVETTECSVKTPSADVILEGQAPSRKRLVPLWKTIPAWAFIAFFSLGVVAGAFADSDNISLVALYLSLLLIPLLALSRARRNSIRRRAKSAGTTPRFGFAERNWLPVGIVLGAALFVVFGVTS